MWRHPTCCSDKFRSVRMLYEAIFDMFRLRYTHRWFRIGRQTSMEDFRWLRFILALGWLLVVVLDDVASGHVATIDSHVTHQQVETPNVFVSSRTQSSPLISSIKVHFDDCRTQMIKALFVACKRGSQADLIIAALGKQSSKKRRARRL